MGDVTPREPTGSERAKKPTGEEAIALLEKARAAGHFPEDFVEKELAAMRGETGDEVRAAGHVPGEAEAGHDEDTDGGKREKELSPEQVWFGEFKTRFEALPQLHEGVQWADVEKSLKADPESMRKLQALDEKGHAMNVFGEEKDELIFASAWDDYSKVSLDHRNIVFDKEAQDYLAKHYPNETCNGNATDIVKALGVDLADTKFHEQLREAIAVNGWAWLKTDVATRATGNAFRGNFDGIYRSYAHGHLGHGSLRAALRVKKV